MLLHQGRRGPWSSGGEDRRGASTKRGALHDDGAMQREAQWQHDLRQQNIANQRRHQQGLRRNKRPGHVHCEQRWSKKAQGAGVKMMFPVDHLQAGIAGVTMAGH